MIPIRHFGFKNNILIDPDLALLGQCLINGYDLESKDIWYRETDDNLELAVVLSYTRDIRSIHSLIKIDSTLEGLRSRNFLIGEIRPAVATYALISIRKGVSK